uniref:Uncharacterized protein n=1 Tax=Rhizophora mucronata TaxID=61149 RepID=A0A2P2PB50_RHIMU
MSNQYTTNTIFTTSILQPKKEFQEKI